MTLAEEEDPQVWHRIRRDSTERRMLEGLSTRFDVRLRPRTLVLPDGSRVEVEGVDADNRFLVQLVANQGTYKSHHRNKVMADMFKLVWLSRSILPGGRAILCVSEAVSQAFSGWVATAARDVGIEVLLFRDDGDIVPLVER
ncbi:hypothetical protein OHA25_36095 [Nonomuraea sp. NBC_00507]|uniref:hypothetical protein n=1 Tax=unclassified Nonomuraea TaxID=2593643 RepID=UPI002E17B96A